ncbi:hypothetical protein MAHJHV57_50440 [Mycobacterium avium subsp. hominissuis]
MARVKAKPSPRATVIGDVVGSRRAADRPALHRRVAAGDFPQSGGDAAMQGGSVGGAPGSHHVADHGRPW